MGCAESGLVKEDNSDGRASTIEDDRDQAQQLASTIEAPVFPNEKVLNKSKSNTNPKNIPSEDVKLKKKSISDEFDKHQSQTQSPPQSSLTYNNSSQTKSLQSMSNTPLENQQNPKKDQKKVKHKKSKNKKKHYKKPAEIKKKSIQTHYKQVQPQPQHMYAYSVGTSDSQSAESTSSLSDSSSTEVQIVEGDTASDDTEDEESTDIEDGSDDGIKTKTTDTTGISSNDDFGSYQMPNKNENRKEKCCSISENEELVNNMRSSMSENPQGIKTLKNRTWKQKQTPEKQSSKYSKHRMLSAENDKNAKKEKKKVMGEMYAGEMDEESKSRSSSTSSIEETESSDDLNDESESDDESDESSEYDGIQNKVITDTNVTSTVTSTVTKNTNIKKSNVKKKKFANL